MYHVDVWLWWPLHRLISPGWLLSQLFYYGHTDIQTQTQTYRYTRPSRTDKYLNYSKEKYICNLYIIVGCINNRLIQVISGHCIYLHSPAHTDSCWPTFVVLVLPESNIHVVISSFTSVSHFSFHHHWSRRLSKQW